MNQTTENIIEQATRMCDAYRCCQDCPVCINNIKSHTLSDCVLLSMSEVSNAPDINGQLATLEQWVKDNPLPKPKSYMDVFFERFPKAKRDQENKPYACPGDCFCISSACPGDGCLACWSRPCLEDEL